MNRNYIFVTFLCYSGIVFSLRVGTWYKTSQCPYQETSRRWWEETFYSEGKDVRPQVRGCQTPSSSLCHKSWCVRGQSEANMKSSSETRDGVGGVEKRGEGGRTGGERGREEGRGQKRRE